MAQTWRSRGAAADARQARPLDEAALERIALRYVERYATTRAKLAAYLRRKVRERGWGSEGSPDLDALAVRLADLGYIDDAGFAAARASSLSRRGYGPRRVSLALKAAGIEAKDALAAEATAREAAWEAALTFARRKKIGPFAPKMTDRASREKAFGAMLRAGHDMGMARRIVQAEPGAVPQSDEG